MNIHTLQYALVLAREGNMRNAARCLYISQPSLSQSISRLEQELGTALFIRERGKIRPTQAGSLYLEWAKKVLESEEDLLDTLKAVRAGHAPSIKIGTTFYRASHVLSEVFPAFLERFPGCKIVVEEHSSPMLEPLLRSRAVDLCLSPNKFDQIDYTDIPLFKEQILLVAPAQMALPSKDTRPYPTVSVETLEKIPFAILAEDLYIGRLARTFFAQLGHEPSILLQCRTLDTALAMVQKGLAATLAPFALPASGRDREHMEAQTRYYQIDHPAAVREVSAIYRKGHLLTAEEEGFLELLGQQFAGTIPG